MEQAIDQIKDEPASRLRLWYFPFARQWMTFWLLVSDLTALLLSWAFGFWVRSQFELWPVDPLAYVPLAAMSFLFLLSYSTRGLYPGFGVSTVDELRRLTIGTTMAFLISSMVLFLIQGGADFSRLIFSLSYLMALGLVPFMRYLFRTLFIHLRLWGEPVAVLGPSDQTGKLTAYFHKHAYSGVVALPFLASAEQISKGNPEPIRELQSFCQRYRIRRVLVSSADWSRIELLERLEAIRAFADQVILVSPFQHPRLMWMSVTTLGEMPGLELRYNLHNPVERNLKRFIDLFGVIVGGLLISPFLILMAILIKLDSKGPVLYRQQRIGRDGKLFTVNKFRTMYDNAEDVLEQTLIANPALMSEWQSTQKLKKDPRVTRMGKFLRKTSMDELPQIINVFFGEMSLVGPRPITEEEVVRYGEKFNRYIQVQPGISGLWQVSGRNDVSYEDRVSMDEFYVHNWSIWLDIYILVKTIFVVIKRNGAY